jgi:hypothetical protein
MRISKYNTTIVTLPQGFLVYLSVSLILVLQVTDDFSADLCVFTAGGMPRLSGNIKRK